MSQTMLRNANDSSANLTSAGSGNNHATSNEDDKNNINKTVPYAVMSGMFEVPQHRWILLVWLAFVVVCNTMSSLVVTSTRPKTLMHYVDSWPPREMMDNVVDNNNRVVVVIVDEKSSVELADNFLASLERQGVFNFCVVPLHKETYEILKRAYPKHVLPPMPVMEQYRPEQQIQSLQQQQLPDFDNVVSIRPNILHAFARAGYTFFCGDVNSVWRTNAFMEINEIVDLNANQGGQYFDAFFFFDDSVSSSIVTSDNEFSLSSTQMFLRPTPATSDFLERWVRYRDNLLLGDDRHAFNGVIKEHTADEKATNNYHPYRTGNRDLTSLQLRFDENKEFRIVIGERARYPSGWAYFDKHLLSDEQRNAVSIVHNGIAGKNNNKQRVSRLEKVGLWQPSGRLQI